MKKFEVNIPDVQSVRDKQNQLKNEKQLEKERLMKLQKEKELKAVKEYALGFVRHVSLSIEDRINNAITKNEKYVIYKFDHKIDEWEFERDSLVVEMVNDFKNKGYKVEFNSKDITHDDPDMWGVVFYTREFIISWS